MTLNEIVTIIKTIALDLRTINTFILGESDAIDIVYPAIECQKQSGTIDRTNHKTIYNFKIICFDKVNVSEQTEANRVDVESDMMSISEDFKAMIENPEYDWEVSESTSYQFIAATFNDDEVAGVSMDISISVPYLSDRCRVPLKSDDEGIYIDTGAGILTSGEDTLLTI